MKKLVLLLIFVIAWQLFAQAPVLQMHQPTITNRRVLASTSYTGQFTAKFDGSKLASVIYICKLENGSFKRIKKLMLLK